MKDVAAVTPTTPKGPRVAAVVRSITRRAAVRITPGKNRRRKRSSRNKRPDSGFPGARHGVPRFYGAKQTHPTFRGVMAASSYAARASRPRSFTLAGAGLVV